MLITMSNYDSRNKISHRAVAREILLSFWKIHILHHAEEGPVSGQWMISELREHGYEISPGTLYPLLQRLERLGWLKSVADPKRGPKDRKDYRLTRQGSRILKHVRLQIKELHGEVVNHRDKKHKS